MAKHGPVLALREDCDKDARRVRKVRAVVRTTRGEGGQGAWRGRPACKHPWLSAVQCLDRQTVVMGCGDQ